MQIGLNNATKTLTIQQSIVWHNKSNHRLDTLYFHDWTNAYSSRKSALSKRQLEDYNKELYFAKDKDKGYTKIHSVKNSDETIKWKYKNNTLDIIEIPLKKPLLAGASIKLDFDYEVKIPNDKFTRYGSNGSDYNLRFWHIIPVVYNGKWHWMSNLNMDDLFMEPTDYKLNVSLPKDYQLFSELDKENSIIINDKRQFILKGKNRVDIELYLSNRSIFDQYNSGETTVHTNIHLENLEHSIKEQTIKRQLDFLEQHLGPYPHKNIFINKIDYKKNPIYGLNQLPSLVTPFSDVYEWDTKIFKVLTEKYLDKTMVSNERENAWVNGGLQTYLMIKYAEKNYPEVNFLGKVAKIWGVKTYNLAKMKMNDKYNFIYQIALRANLDQPLNTRTDSLSNSNRKIVNRYKAGLGLLYVDDYMNGTALAKGIHSFYNENILSLTNKETFEISLKKHATKNIDWFFDDYIRYNKKIDYTIKKIDKQEDTIAVTIKNKTNTKVPISLFGINKDSILYKEWVFVDSLKTLNIPNKNYKKLSLNYGNKYPEFNARDNWIKTNSSLLNRPLQVRLFKDAENPYYNQLFLSPDIKYNYYDGIGLGMSFSNKTFLNKAVTYKFTPSYGTKSSTLTGSGSIIYKKFLESPIINSYRIGLSGNYFHYKEDLSYQTFSPFVNVFFRRKSMRDVGGSALTLSYKLVDREMDPTDIDNSPEKNKYNVLNLNFGYSKPEIINDFRYNVNYQLADKFSKASVDVRFRKLTNANRQFDVRLYAGAFLSNKTETDFFDFALDRPSDYLFQYNYLGRSETAGFFSQQIIINEGGFKSFLPNNRANQWLTSLNTSVGIWRWAEVYNDFAFVKNRNQNPYFAHESGVRLNFIHNILEFYFPVHSNLGWEIADKNYATKIRFVLTIHPAKILSFFRRGFI